MKQESDVERKEDSPAKKTLLSAVESEDSQASCCHGSRRALLGGIGGTIAGGLLSAIGFTELADAIQGPSVTTTEMERAANEYDSIEEVRSALEAHSTGVIEALYERDLIERPSIDALPLESVADVPEFTDALEGVSVSGMGRKDGQGATAHIMVKWQSGDREVALITRPQSGRTYAQIKAPSGDTSRILHPNEGATSESADTDEEYILSEPCIQDCACYLTACDEIGCCTQYEVNCCDSSCYTGTSCGACSGCSCENCCCQCPDC